MKTAEAHNRIEKLEPMGFADPERVCNSFLTNFREGCARE